MKSKPDVFETTIIIPRSFQDAKKTLKISWSKLIEVGLRYMIGQDQKLSNEIGSITNGSKPNEKEF
jgi:hypothetical protein